jgi:hypothetical protein
MVESGSDFDSPAVTGVLSVGAFDCRKNAAAAAMSNIRAAAIALTL